MTSERHPAATEGRPPLPAAPAWPEDASRRPVRSELRLQPVMLGPPPDPNAVGASSEDDLDPTQLRRSSATGRTFAVVATVVLLAAGAGGAYVFLGRPTPGVDEPRIPTEAPPAAAVAPQPPEQAPSAAVSAPPAPAPQPSPAVDMAEIGTDLVAPSTEGLSPARKVQSIRIVVDKDRELPQPR
jgi:hypothetical protein